jgi:ADP-heptose:LPS heptosyltransferase
MTLRPHVLACRLDSAGDVLLTGPALRALAAGADRVTLLCGPRGREAARLLPGVDEVRVFLAPWIDPQPPAVEESAILGLRDEIAGLNADEAVIFTSAHQSSLPLALVLRLAGVPRIGAISDDYPGSLLDVRHRVPPDIHEVERALSLVRRLGYELPGDDDDRLRITSSASRRPCGRHPKIAIHPGASVPARTWGAARWRALVDALVARGHHLVITGSVAERDLVDAVAGPPRPTVMKLPGATTLQELAGVLADAEVLVAGNTGPAHLAAAVGTPVVSIFAPTVPATCWRPWGVPQRLLGNQHIACAGCRATVCPVAGHPCISEIPLEAAVDAVESLGRSRNQPSPLEDNRVGVALVRENGRQECA